MLRNGNPSKLLHALPSEFSALMKLIKENKITKLMISNWGRDSANYEDHYWFDYRGLPRYLSSYHEAYLVVQLFNAIQENTSIVELRTEGLHLAYTSIDGWKHAVFKAFCDMVRRNFSLKVIELDRSVFHSESSSYYRSNSDGEKYRSYSNALNINLSWFLDALSANPFITCVKFNDSTFAKDPLDENSRYATQQWCQFIARRQEHASLRLSFGRDKIDYREVFAFLIKQGIFVKELEIINYQLKREALDVACIDALRNYLTVFKVESIILKYRDCSELAGHAPNQALIKEILNHDFLKKVYIQKGFESWQDFFLDKTSDNEKREELILNDFVFSTRFFEKLAHLVKHSLKLKKLSLGTEEVMGGFDRDTLNSTKKGFQTLLQVIGEHPALETLEIVGGQWLHEERLEFICNMVKQRTRPLVLNLSDLYYVHMEHLSGDYLGKLESILSQPMIKAFIYAPTVRLAFTFETKTLRPIIQALRSNVFLQTLDLRNNNIDNEGATLIAAAILANPYSAINAVLLDGNRVDLEYQQKVNNAIETVKQNERQAIQPYKTFSFLAYNTHNRYHLPLEVVKQVVQYGLFSAIGKWRRPNEVNELVDQLVLDTGAKCNPSPKP